MISDEYREKVMSGRSHWLDRSSDVGEFVRILNGNFSNLKGLLVLDAGCAQGRDSLEIFNWGMDVVGIDINKDFILEAKNICSEMQFDVGSVEHLPYENDKFDAVYCVNTLFYTDLKKSLLELMRILKKGGIAFVTLDEKIVDLEKNVDVYSLDVEKSLEFFGDCNIVSKNYLERIDDSPFRHKHFLYQIVIRKD